MNNKTTILASVGGILIIAFMACVVYTMPLSKREKTKEIITQKLVKEEKKNWTSTQPTEVGFYWANIVYKDQVNKVIVGVVDVDPVKGLLIRIWAAPHYDLYEGWIQEIDLNGAVITWANKIEAPADDK